MAATLAEILAIPGNQAVYDRLRALLAEGSATAFVGAGASYPLFPLWPQLIQKLAHEPVAHGLATGIDEQYWLRIAGQKPLQAASQIHQKLGDALYHTFLHEEFKDRNQPFTPAHDAVMRMNFRAWLTTNYDSGLVEAGRLNRFTIWNQTYEAGRWLNGDIFKDSIKPVLYAHGHFTDPANIVLDRESYRRAYVAGPYRRLFEDLWIREHLVFVGFSFNDVTLAGIADEVLYQVQAPGVRHIAILGLSDPYTPEMRREFLEPFHADVLFYPVAGHDHSALGVLLESLAAPAAPNPALPSVKAATKLVQHFVHETTEDEKFTGRTDQLARLNRWAADAKVRLIAITGMGGLGKTALLGHWLRACGRNVFFWSFYREQSSGEFFRALAGFGVPGIIALDGLEVLQEVPGTLAYGKLLDLQLADFLHERFRTTAGSLVVLTSRFPFPDLAPYIGRGLQSMPLPSLNDLDGAALLDSLGVPLGQEDRIEISRRLEGHPLALRIYARSGRRDVPADGTLETKVRHLLEFYETRIPPAQRQALGLVALFRMPVDVAALLPLWQKLLQQTGSPESVLQELHREHLLTLDRGPDGSARYSSHPILRDHFRNQIVRLPEFAREAGILLAGLPGAQPRTLEEVQVIATAIETLLDAGLIIAADELYRSRLQNGDIFKWLPAPHWGLALSREFVRTAARREALGRQLSQSFLSFYLSSVGLYANNAGEPETALDFYGQAADINRKEKRNASLSTNLRNVCETKISLGMLVEAAGNIEEALQLVTDKSSAAERHPALGFSGLCASLRGDLAGADRDFAEANGIGNELYQRDLFSVSGVHWAQHLLRTAREARARQLTEANAEFSTAQGWHEDRARCRWILGWLDTLAGDWPSAHAALDYAKSTFARGHLIYELVRTLLTESLCFLGEGRLDNSLASCERVLDLAAPRNYRLIHADAINLRARIALARNDHSAARDDAEAALQIAEPCEYAWALRDSAEILASAYRVLEDKDLAFRYQKDFEDWRRRLEIRGQIP